MSTTPKARAAQLQAAADYRDTLAAMDEAAFVKAAEMQIWLSIFANNNPRAPAHWKADAAYDEAVRRETPWLYQRAWNQAARSHGHEPSEADIQRARPAERVGQVQG